MKHRALIGIEVTGREVRGALVRFSGSGATLCGVATAPAPESAIDKDGAIDAHAISDAVRSVCAQLDSKTNHAVIGVTGCDLVARVMEIPPVPDPEVRAVLRGEMDHYRILPSGQSAFDYHRLPDAPTQGDEGQGEQVARVLLMGAEERVVGSFRAVADSSGLNVVAVEPGSIAALRALFPLVRSDDAVATVVLSSNSTDVFITQSGALHFYRQVDTGVSELTGKRAETDGSVTMAAAGTLLGGDPDDGAPVAKASVAHVAGERFNRQAVSLLMTEVQRSIDYYMREFPSAGEKMSVRMAIDSPDAEALFNLLTEYLRSDALHSSVFASVPLSGEAAHLNGSTDSYRYTVCVGLALRGAGGEFQGAPVLDFGRGDKVIVERREAPRFFAASLAASAMILVGTVIAAISVGFGIGKAERSLQQAKTELESVTKQHAERVAALDRQKRLVDLIHIRSKPLREAVEFVSASVARRATLTTLVIDQNGGIILSGQATTPRVVADIMDTINMANTLEPIRLMNLSRSTEFGSEETLKFDLQTAFLSNVSVQTAGSSRTPAPSGGA